MVVFNSEAKGLAAIIQKPHVPFPPVPNPFRHQQHMNSVTPGPGRARALSMPSNNLTDHCY